MKKGKVILIILINLAIQLQGQTIKTYNGTFESRQAKGRAIYQYTENESYERLYNGNFKFVEDKNTMIITGAFKQNLKDGNWKFTLTNFPSFGSTNNATIIGGFKLGQMNGNWTYSHSRIEQFMNISNNMKTNSRATFSNGTLVGLYEYTSSSSYKKTSISIKGRFNESGFFDSTWIIKKIIDGVESENIRKYKNGILFFNLYRNIATGEILFKDELTINLDDFFKIYDPQKNYVKFDNQNYSLEIVKNCRNNDSEDLNNELYESISEWKNNHKEFFGTIITDPINYQFEIQQGSINTDFYPERKLITN